MTDYVKREAAEENVKREASREAREEGRAVGGLRSFELRVSSFKFEKCVS